MYLDASPWGGGAFMSKGAEPVAWLATAWSEEDVAHLGLRIGDHRDQALAELLVVVVAARVWASWWSQTPTVLTTRSDSIAALGALEKGASTRSKAMNYLVQEFTLLLASSFEELRLRYKHVPGSRNEWADALSRLAQPGSGAQVPGPLRHLAQTPVPPRAPAWWLLEGPKERITAALPEGPA